MSFLHSLQLVQGWFWFSFSAGQNENRYKELNKEGVLVQHKGEKKKNLLQL